jgi:hypothetical protein
MDNEQAKIVAEALGGTSWDSGGGINLIKLERQDGCLVVLSDEVVCEYKNEEDFNNNKPVNSIFLH